MDRPDAHEARPTGPLARLARGGVGVVMLFLLIAGAAKLYDLPAFVRALATWEWVPTGLVPPLAFTVPSLEVFVAGCWFLRVWRHGATLTALGLLVVFTGFYALHLATAQPPDCGCLGRLLAHADSLNDARWVLGRNTLFIGALA